VVLAGFMSDLCVLGTNLTALVRDYKPRALAHGTAPLSDRAPSAVETVVHAIDLESLSHEIAAPPDGWDHGQVLSCNGDFERKRQSGYLLDAAFRLVA
jgi:hypothetical protein